MTRTRTAGVYLASVNWEKLGLMALAGGAAAHYLTPWLLTVLLPYLVQHGYLARIAGAQALAKAAILRWRYEEEAKIRGAQEEEVGTTMSITTKDIPEVGE